MTTAQIISWVLILGTVGYAIYGGWRGAIAQAASVLAFLIGFLGARLFAPGIAAHLQLPQFACFTIVYILCFLGVKLIAKALHLTITVLLLEWLNRLPGAIIGGIKWLLLTSLIINLLILCSPETTLFSAPFSQWVAAFAQRLFGLALNLYNAS